VVVELLTFTFDERESRSGSGAGTARASRRCVLFRGALIREACASEGLLIGHLLALGSGQPLSQYPRQMSDQFLPPGLGNSRPQPFQRRHLRG
jgi:hypothetical protein